MCQSQLFVCDYDSNPGDHDLNMILESMRSWKRNIVCVKLLCWTRVYDLSITMFQFIFRTQHTRYGERDYLIGEFCESIYVLLFDF